MPVFRVFIERARAHLRGRQHDAELNEEIRTHLAMLAADHARRGLPRPDAERAARRDFGSVEGVKEIYRVQQRLAWIDGFLRDLRLGVRLLARYPGFSALTILTLAVVIGANTAVYTLVDHLLLRPLPYPEPGRLATIVRHYERGATSGDGYSQNGATWLLLRDNLPELDLAAVGSAGGVNL